jgi:hypothetical protein
MAKSPDATPDKKPAADKATEAPQKPAPKGGTMTIVNQRAGKLVLLDGRIVPPGGSAEVSAAEGAKLVKHRGIVDAAKMAPALGSEIARLRARCAELEAENAKLKKA